MNDLVSHLVPESPLRLRTCPACGAIYRCDFARCPSDGAVIAETHADPVIGKRLGDYMLTEYIGEGSMGRVYRALHHRLWRRRVAIKVLLGDCAASRQMRERFGREAQSASILAHPNVVSVLDVGESAEGLLYMVMELVEGRTLGDVIADGPLDSMRAVRIARQLCLGLAHAHDRGVIHRDLKPDNIVIVRGEDGELARIVDFGLAILSDARDAMRLTSDGWAIGTPAYMSPEQISNSREIDHRADLFALGVTMFEMLAGALPFEGSGRRVIQLTLAADPPAIGAVAPDCRVPPRLERIVRRLMARRREDRYASASAVIEDLDRFVAGCTGTITEPVEPLPPPVIESVARSPSHQLARWLLVPAAVAVAVAAIGLALPGPGRPPPPSAIPPVLPTAPMTARASVAAPVDPPPRAAAPEPPSASERPTAPERATVTRRKTRPRRSAPPPAPPPIARAAERVPAPPVAPARPPSRVRVHVRALSVDGPLARSEIRRAIDRVLPSIPRCYPLTGSVRDVVRIAVRFTIGNNRRATAVSTSDSKVARLGPCVAAAFRRVRSDAAPDVGHARVSLIVTFTPELR